MQCYTICIQLQFRAPGNPAVARALAANPQAAAVQQAQRLSVAYNNLGGILKMQVRPCACRICEVVARGLPHSILFTMVPFWEAPCR